MTFFFFPSSPTSTNDAFQQDRTIRLWNPARNLLVKSYTGGHASSSDGVRCLAASADSSRVASGGGGSGGIAVSVVGTGNVVGGGARGDVAWWDVATGAVVRKWHGHDAAVNAVCLFDNSGGGGGGGGAAAATTSTSLVVSASDDATARAWDPRSRSSTPVQVLRGARDSLTGVGVGNNGENKRSPVIVTSSVDGKLRSYDPRKAEQSVDDVGSAIAAMRLGCSGGGGGKGNQNNNNNNNNDCALLACLDGRLRLLDLRSGARLAELSGHDASLGVRTDCRLFSSCSNPSSSSSSSPASSLYAACGSEDGRVCAWSVESEAMVASVSIHSGDASANASSSSSSTSTSGPVTALAIRPGDSGMLLAAGTDGRVRVFQRRGNGS